MPQREMWFVSPESGRRRTSKAVDRKVRARRGKPLNSQEFPIGTTQKNPHQFHC